MGRHDDDIDSDLRRFRRAQGLTIAGMAKRLGYSASYLGRVERHEVPLAAQLVARCEQVFGASPLSPPALEDIPEDTKEPLPTPLAPAELSLPQIPGPPPGPRDPPPLGTSQTPAPAGSQSWASLSSGLGGAVSPRTASMPGPPKALRSAVALVLAGALALVSAAGTLTAAALGYAQEARLDSVAPAENARLVAAARAGCGLKDEWGHVHSEAHRGRVWIRVEPAPEHADRPHRYVVVWGQWATEGWLDFSGQEDTTREAYLLHTKFDRSAWPLSVRVDPPACVLFGVRRPPGEHLVSLDSPWRYQPAAGWLQQAGLR